MGLNFPSSPTDGQVFGDYVYNSAKGVWLVSEVTVPTVTTDDNPPSSPKDGDMWMYTGDGTVFVFYQDIDGGQWIQTGGGAVEPKTDSLPAGSVIMWAAAAAPVNWLLCDGAVVDRADWPSLFANIGTTYNTGGELSTQFRLPNLKGRVAAGLDTSQSEFDALGETGGTKTHTLTVAEMPSHQHESPFPSNPGGDSGGNFQEIFGSGRTASQTGQTSEIYNNDVNAGAEGNELHPLVSATGGGQAHNNLQPYIVLNYIIKATAGVTAGDTVLETRVGELESSADDPIKLNGQVISANYSIPVGYNGLSAGPITIASGVTVTIPDGSAWSVV